MREFFQNLKEKREEKGITLEEIHNKTYLPVHYLQKIESGELEELPTGYDRLYLKRYASAIGLDTNEVMRDYDMFSGKLKPSDSGIKNTSQIEKPAINTKILTSEQSTHKRPSLKSSSKLEQLNLDKLHKYFWIFLAASIVVVTGFITYRQYIHEKNNQITIKEIPSTEVSKKMIALSSLNSVEDEKMTQAEKNQLAGSSAEPKKSFVVELRAIDTTWVRQIQDEKDTTEYILPPGLNRRVEAKEQLKFMVGKADGVEFWLNGDSLGVMGNADEVVLSLIISDKGIIEKKLKKVAKKSSAKIDTTVAVIPIL